jgi:chromosome segregation ATPase
MQPVDHYEQRQVVREVHRERIGVHSAQHQELFIAELTAEIHEIQSRSRDFEALREQYAYLQSQYQEAQLEKSRLESDCL